MKLATLALASMLALSGPFALAHGQRHHHHWRHSASRCSAVRTALRVDRRPSAGPDLRLTAEISREPGAAPIDRRPGRCVLMVAYRQDFHVGLPLRAGAGIGTPRNEMKTAPAHCAGAVALSAQGGGTRQGQTEAVSYFFMPLLLPGPTVP